MRPILAVLGVLALIAAPARAQAPGPFRLSLGYDGRLLVKVLDIQVSEEASGSAFAASARLKPSGVLAVFRRFDTRASAHGRIVHGEPRPGTFHHQNIDGKSNRKVDLTWTGSDVEMTAEPPWTRLGDPPAS